MSKEPSSPAIAQINIIVRNMPASIAFYRRLGVKIDESGAEEWAAHHASAKLAGGITLDLDSQPFAKQWNLGFKDGEGGQRVLFFSVPTRDGVDGLYETMTASGYRGQQPPSDGFWGARYAIVEDPDGNPIGLTSPIDPAYQRRPPAPPT